MYEPLHEVEESSIVVDLDYMNQCKTASRHHGMLFSLLKLHQILLKDVFEWYKFSRVFAQALTLTLQIAEFFYHVQIKIHNMLTK